MSDIEKKWREENSVIYFTVTSDGTTGPQWIKRLRERGIQFARYTDEILLSRDFKPTSGIIYEIAVLMGEKWSDGNRTTDNIFDEVAVMGLGIPNPEVACLTREKFSGKEILSMGLWRIVTMHEPIKCSGPAPRMLTTSNDYNGLLLRSNYLKRNSSWGHKSGFALVHSQTAQG